MKINLKLITTFLARSCSAEVTVVSYNTMAMTHSTQKKLFPKWQLSPLDDNLCCMGSTERNSLPKEPQLAWQANAEEWWEFIDL